MDAVTAQLQLFTESTVEPIEREPDSPDKPKPGAIWNGKIWASDDDLPEGF